MAKIELPGDEIVTAAIRRDYAGFFSISKGIGDMAGQFVVGNQMIGPKKSSHVVTCALGVYAKQIRSFVAAHRLCYDGLGIEAELHARAMFTVMLYSKALEKSSDQKEFARQWVLWCVANAEKQLRMASHLRDDLAKLAKEREGLFDREKQAFGGNWKSFVRYGPVLKDLASLANDVGETDQYLVFYPQASAGTHGYDLAQFIKPKADGHLDLMMSPSEKSVRESLVGASHSLIKSLDVLNRLLDLGRDNLIQKMTAAYLGFGQLPKPRKG